jgi:hypothetical protein
VAIGPFYLGRSIRNNGYNNNSHRGRFPIDGRRGNRGGGLGVSAEETDPEVACQRSLRRANNVIRDLHRRLHHIHYRACAGRLLAARASEVDRSIRFVPYRDRNHPRRDGDSAKGSCVEVK